MSIENTIDLETGARRALDKIMNEKQKQTARMKKTSHQFTTPFM